MYGRMGSNGTEGRRGGGGGCFIATAAFGTTAESHVGILRDFRDQYLHSCQFGRKFISAYSLSEKDFGVIDFVRKCKLVLDFKQILDTGY